MIVRWMERERDCNRASERAKDRQRERASKRKLVENAATSVAWWSDEQKQTLLAVNACIPCRRTANVHNDMERECEWEKKKRWWFGWWWTSVTYSKFLFNECKCVGGRGFMYILYYIHLEVMLDWHRYYCCWYIHSVCCCFHCVWALINYWNFCKISNSIFDGKIVMNTHITSHHGIRRGEGPLLLLLLLWFLENLGTLLRVNVLHLNMPGALTRCHSLSPSLSLSASVWRFHAF